MSQLTYNGLRSSGFRPDVARILFGMDPNEHEDEFQKLTTEEREGYKCFVANSSALHCKKTGKTDAQRRHELIAKTRLAFQAAMANGVIDTVEFERCKESLEKPGSLIKLTNLLVRIREKREELRPYLGDQLWES